jgi:hypothetical protein
LPFLAIRGPDVPKPPQGATRITSRDGPKDCDAGTFWHRSSPTLVLFLDHMG